MFENRSFDSR